MARGTTRRRRGAMRGEFVGAATTLGLLLASAAGGAAQVAWDAPLFVHPHAPHGWSLLLSEPHPGDEVAVTAAWRTAPVPVGFGLRVGIGEGIDGDVAIFGGVDATGRILEYSAETPLDLIWVAGGGLGVAGDILLSLPAGLVAGWDLRADGVRFHPYVGPRVVLDAWIGDRDPGESDGLDLEAVVDLGLDVVLDGGWVVRTGFTLGDRDALGVGVTLPAPGRR